MHSLRHIFTIHLLKCKIYLRYIQKLLGYKSSKATEIFTHVNAKNPSTIKNPLDNLLKGMKYENKNKEQWQCRGMYIRTAQI
ncbi:MAG: tyrosine-type recombinase/integrase [Thermosipho sp. (in: Bacteria)]|nr:tyrosine-type recombinase/integrase [Thermosipho sp. (in: thermotogales)]